eukprot:c24958_g1_i1 orf=694-1758(+)
MAPQLECAFPSPPLHSSTPQRAFVTFLAGAGDYVKGIEGLAKGLRKVGSLYPLIVALLDDVPEHHRQLLRMQGCIVREIDRILPDGHDQCDFAMAYYVINYSKLRIWLFEEYEKMIYLDADIMVFENIDHLFELPNGNFYAVMDCFCEKTWSHSRQYKVNYCQQCPDKNPWPEHIGSAPARYFNAGMFLFEPSKNTFDELMVALKSNPLTPFAEQDFLNMFFTKIYKPIPLVYNLVMAMLWRHPENVTLQNVKVVHYCAAGSKPWRYTGEEINMDRDDIKMLVRRWWDIYNDKTLDYPTSALVSATKEARPDLSEACADLNGLLSDLPNTDRTRPLSNIISQASPVVVSVPRAA